MKTHDPCQDELSLGTSSITTENWNYTGPRNYTDTANYTDGPEECLPVVVASSEAGGSRGFGASWVADLARLTFCTSEGARDRKSTTSLLSMLYGFRSFLVNLWIPKTKIQTNTSLRALSQSSSLFLHQQTLTLSKKRRNGAFTFTYEDGKYFFFFAYLSFRRNYKDVPAALRENHLYMHR